MSEQALPIAIVGGGIAGLALALHLHARGITARVFEGASELRELGVGITLLPHAVRELNALGLGDEAAKLGVDNVTSAFYNRFGQRIFAEPESITGSIGKRVKSVFARGPLSKEDRESIEDESRVRER